ncbi:MAG TPA: hypothetical protein VG844_10620 [Terracidiphilus sp.]|nr:hypothetical protein [Terracidiphilus sp.]
MKKPELELLLIDCDRLRALCERMNRCYPCAIDAASDQPQNRLQRVKNDPLQPGPTPEDVRKNLRYLSRPFTLSHFFGPYDSAEEQLRQAIKQYRERPCVKTSTLVDLAINRAGVGDRSDEKLLQLIQEAKHLLAAKLKAKKGEKGFQADNVTGAIFKDSDFHGSSLFMNLSFGGLLTGYVNLSDFHFNDVVSSAQLTASPDEVGGRLFLFQNARFFGRYVGLDANSGQSTSLSSMDSFMNDRTSSVLIYRKSPNEISSALSSVVSTSTIKNLISSQKKLSPRGEPVLTWDLFPDGKDGHPNETGKMYIYIRIPVSVAVDHWFDYDAEIRYWIYLYIDQNGQLQASLDYYGAWVEGGLITSHVLDGLMAPDGIPSSIDQVRNLLATATSSVNMLSGPFMSVYLLPGRNEAKGNTDDDVTVVLVEGTPQPPGPIL